MKGDAMTDDEFRDALGDKRESLGLDRETGEPTHIVHLAWESGGETFAMSVKRGYQREALRTLGRWASDPSIAMGWFEAAMISKEIREAF